MVQLEEVEDKNPNRIACACHGRRRGLALYIWRSYVGSTTYLGLFPFLVIATIADRTYMFGPECRHTYMCKLIQAF